MTKGELENTAPFRSDPVWLLGLLPYPLLLISLLETLRLPWAQLGEHYSVAPLFLHSWGNYLFVVSSILAMILLVQGAIVALARFSGGHRLRLGVVAAGGSALTVHIIYRLLMAYAPFRDFYPFLVIAIFAAVLLAYATFRCIAPSPLRASSNRLSLIIGAGICLLGVVLLWFHHTFFPSQYGSLHISLIAAAFLALFWGPSLLFSTISRPNLWNRGFLTVTAIAMSVTLGLFFFALVKPLPDHVPPFLAASDLMLDGDHHLPSQGRHDDSLLDFECINWGEELTQEEATALFLDQSGFPTLQGQLPLDELNILLIMVETTRFDQTSLGAESPWDTTPNLAAFARNGAFNFTRAYAPSSMTSQSVSSVMSMTPPTFSPLLIDHYRAWVGGVLDDAHRVPEIFAGMGHSTFRVSHGMGFGTSFFGFDRGFDVNHVQPDFRWADESLLARADIDLREEATSILSAFDEEDGPFLGWIFFGSPHRPYLARSGADDASDIERYREEIRHVDEEIHLLLRQMEDSGLLDETVVIITSDHGEEFGEHGATSHGHHLYEESIHIPLLVRIPGHPGSTVDTPVSLYSLFPWLMLHGPERVRAEAISPIQRVLAPALLAAEGRVVSERIGRNRTLVSLISANEKIIANLNTGRIEFYDLLEDRRELEDLFLHQREPVLQKVRILRQYLAFRACNPTFQFTAP